MSGRNRQKTKGRKDSTGGFAGIPRAVLDNPSYKNLSGGAVKLLVELARQYKGEKVANNGDLTIAYSVLKERGFNSKSTIKRCSDELLQANLIIQTRPGYFINPGGRCALYGLTWLPIHECPGKDLLVAPTKTPPRKFSLENSQDSKKPGPEIGTSAVQKRGRFQAKDEKGRFTAVH